MEIKKAIYKTVQKPTRVLVSGSIYGCDECKKEIKEWPNETSRLEIKPFYQDSREKSDFHFCSWDCVLKFLTHFKTDYFISLPYLYFDERDDDKRHGKRLIKLIKESNITKLRG